MKIGRFRVPLTAADGPTSQTPSRVEGDVVERRKQIGGSGTINLDGYLVPSEYNPDLNHLAAMDIWERMRRSDPAVRETLWHMYAPIMNARWTIESPDDPEDDEAEVAEFVRCALFEWMNQPFTEFLQQALSYLCFGHMAFETVFQVVEKSLVIKQKVEQPDEDAAETPSTPGMEAAAPPPPPGKPPTATVPKTPPPAEMVELPPRQFVTWRRFSQRLPKTIYRWNEDDFGELRSITQNTYVGPEAAYVTVDIPAEYLILFTNEKWGDEYTGISVLRAAYKPWVLKEIIEKIMGIAYERHGVGIPVIYVPRDREGDDEVLEELARALEQLRAGEFSYMIFPGPQAQGNTIGYTFEIVSPGGGFPDFKPVLEYLRGEIKGSVLARFSELGHSATGARATANVQSEVWYAALHSVARYVEDVMNQAIRRLVDMNYGGEQQQRRYPKLRAAGIEARNLLEFAQTVALLTNAQLLSPDGPTREWVRDTVDAPAEDQDEQEYMRQAEQMQMQMEVDALSIDARQAETKNPAETARPRAENAKADSSDVGLTGQQPTEVHVHLADLLTIERPEPTVIPPAEVVVNVQPVTVPAPQVDVHVDRTPVSVTVLPAEVKAPDVKVTNQVKPAAVTVENVVDVNVPPAPDLVADDTPKTITFERWPDGKIRSAKVEDAKE